jgi:hypothetical protein
MVPMRLRVALKRALSSWSRLFGRRLAQALFNLLGLRELLP